MAEEVNRLFKAQKPNKNPTNTKKKFCGQITKQNFMGLNQILDQKMKILIFKQWSTKNAYESQ